MQASRKANELSTERESLYTELAAFAARDDDQRLLINTIATAAQRGDHAHLLDAPPKLAPAITTLPGQTVAGGASDKPPAADGAATKVAAATQGAASAQGAADEGGGSSGGAVAEAGNSGSGGSGAAVSVGAGGLRTRPLADSDVVTLISLSGEKTELKVSERTLRLSTPTPTHPPSHPHHSASPSPSP